MQVVIVIIDLSNESALSDFEESILPKLKGKCGAALLVGVKSEKKKISDDDIEQFKEMHNFRGYAEVSVKNDTGVTDAFIQALEIAI